MLPTADQVSALLQALGLTASVLKPIPSLVGGITGSLDGVVSAVDGVTHGLGLPGLEDLPLIGNILEALPSTNQSPFKALKAPSNKLVVNTDGSCAVQMYDPPPVLYQTFPPFDQAKANIFRYRQQQAVNLGSWFVHEQWMTPSVFTCASGPKNAEIDIATGWGNTTGARAVLEYHWDTFITQSDFQYLASIGINTVRLPIGYWSLGPLYCRGTPFEPVADVYTNSWSRVVRAINWAGEAGIGVLVDLHGAPGSQNGQAHSGISDGQENFFNNSTNQDATIEVLTFLAQQLAAVTNVVGIEILNEPNDDPSLPGFYNRTITAIRQSSAQASTLPLYTHDAFNLDRYADFISTRTDFVVEDHHSYFVFDSSDASQSADQELANVDGGVFQQLYSAGQKAKRNLIVGEWSCALTNQSLSGEQDPMLSRQQFCQGQESVYANTTAGLHFWSYTNEGCDSDLNWCFRNAVGNTLQSTFFAYNTTLAPSATKSLYLGRAVAEMELPAMKEVLAQARGQSDSSDVSSNSDNSDATPISPPSISKRNVGAGRQRFSRIHSRRAFLSEMSKHNKRDAIPSPLQSLTDAERAITKGYSDGFLTAKIFAQYGLSKLGFIGQYISDSIAKLGPTYIPLKDEKYYRDWFMRGLRDAEAAISEAAST